MYDELFCRLSLNEIKVVGDNSNSVECSLLQEVYKKYAATKVPMVVDKTQEGYITREVARVQALKSLGLQVVSCFIRSAVPRDLSELYNMFTDEGLRNKPLTYLEIGLIVKEVMARNTTKKKSKLADKLGLDLSMMFRAVALCDLPFEVQHLFSSEQLSISLLDSFRVKKVKQFSDEYIIKVAYKALSALKKHKRDTVKN